MSKRVLVEISSSGRYQYVYSKRPRPHGHGSHYGAPPPTERRDFYNIRVEDWHRVKEKELYFEAKMVRLIAEVAELKKAHAAAKAEVKYLRSFVPRLEAKIDALKEENARLRRSSCAGRGGPAYEVEERLRRARIALERENTELGNYNCSLNARNERLKRQVERCSDKLDRCKERCWYWQQRSNKAEQLNEEYRRTLWRR